MPGAHQDLALLHPGRAPRRLTGRDERAGDPALAERPILVRADVRQRVVAPLHVEDTHLQPAPLHDAARALGKLVHARHDMISRRLSLSGAPSLWTALGCRTAAARSRP